jgi:hypothetical protein
VTGYGIKGFVCKLRSVKRADSVRALRRPLDSGLTFEVDHPSGAIGKLLSDVPYEFIRDVKCVFFLHSYMPVSSSDRSSEPNCRSITPGYIAKE